MEIKDLKELKEEVKAIGILALKYEHFDFVHDCLRYVSDIDSLIVDLKERV